MTGGPGGSGHRPADICQRRPEGCPGPKSEDIPDCRERKQLRLNHQRNNTRTLAIFHTRY